MNWSTAYLLELLGWTALLAALLFIPVSRLIRGFSVRRLQRKLNRELTEAEIGGQLQRARLIAFVLVTIFSLLFNFNTLGIPGRE